MKGKNMIYCISDIHGMYDKFIELLEKIGFSDSDTLYILGDVLDRGPQPITTLLKIMECPNMIMLAGNHEIMALPCLRFLTQDVTEDSINNINDDILESLMLWDENGSETTIKEFRKLPMEKRSEILDFFPEMSVYEELNIGTENDILVHAGLHNFSPERPINEYYLEELIWERPDYSVPYFTDRYVVTGHTPTRFIECNSKPDEIFIISNHIAIDCGAYLPNGKLGAICLDTGECFYTCA